METPVTFECEGSVLMGILSIPDTPPRRGVVFVVADGPQYRAGVQRQFVTLARAMEQSGYAALRFDYRGMGDSEGVHRGFEHVNADIKAAIDALLAHCSSIEEVVLWGECDSSAAVLFYAYKDKRYQHCKSLGKNGRGACKNDCEALLFKTLVRESVLEQAVFRTIPIQSVTEFIMAECDEDFPCERSFCVGAKYGF